MYQFLLLVKRQLGCFARAVDDQMRPFANIGRWGYNNNKGNGWNIDQRRCQVWGFEPITRSLLCIGNDAALVVADYGFDGGSNQSARVFGTNDRAATCSML